MAEVIDLSATRARLAKRKAALEKLNGDPAMVTAKGIADDLCEELLRQTPLPNVMTTSQVDLMASLHNAIARVAYARILQG
jgi:hypothetical protein